MAHGYHIAPCSPISATNEAGFSGDDPRIRSTAWYRRAPHALALCAAQGGTAQPNFDPPFIIKPNSDVRLLAVSSGTTTTVAASINGYLATISPAGD